jgi:predicted ATP-dependent serine protease
MDIKAAIEEEKKKQESLFGGIKERIKGKVSVLYGDPFVGKSLFALNLSKQFKNSTLLLIDMNYVDEYFSINKELKVIKVSSPKQLEYYLGKEIEVKEDQLLIVDSITSLAPFFITETYITPRGANAFSNFVDKVMRHLATLKPTTSLVITHEKLKSFESKDIVPRINMIALRHADIVMRMWITESGERKIEIVKERKMPSKIDFSFVG